LETKFPNQKSQELRTSTFDRLISHCRCCFAPDGCRNHVLPQTSPLARKVILFHAEVKPYVVTL